MPNYFCIFTFYFLMKRYQLSSALLAISMVICSCKKEEVDPQTFIQQHLLGAWPIKYNIRTTFTDGIETKRDTLTTYNPVDTLVFTAEGQAIRKNKIVISSVGYRIGDDGETITFATSPAITYKFTFVHITSIGLGTETSTIVGGKNITTQIADHLNRK